MASKIQSNYVKNFPHLFFTLLAVVILLTVNVLNAQTGLGMLQGKVVDKSTGEALPGASVYFQSTGVGTMSDIEGNFRISNISQGKHDLIVSYIGYKKQTIPVTVTSAKTVTLTVKLESELMQGKEIVVSAQLQGQAQAINQQITSDQIVNVVSEQKIKELPDANAAESAGRLPGVAVQRDGGEASKLMIRGLDPRFTNVTVNGIQMSSTDPDNRSVDLSLVSQSSLSGIELFKSLTPDQDADAIAGVVNLMTGQAKIGQKIGVSMFGIYSGLTKDSKQYRFSGQYSNRFFDDFLGVQAAVNVESRDRNSESFIDSWSIPANGDFRISGLTVGVSNETRKRYGADLNLDINTNDGGTIKFLNSYSKTTRNQFLSNRDYNTGASYVTYIAEAIDRDIYSFNNSLIGNNHLDALKIDWALYYAFTKNEKPFDHWMRFYENETTTSGMRIITDPGVLKLPGVNLIPYALNNFQAANLDRCFFYQDKNQEGNYGVKLDLEYPFKVSDAIAGFVKGGYKYNDKIRDRTFDEHMTAYWLRDSFDYTYDDNGKIVKKDWANSDWPNRYTGQLTNFLSGPPYETRNINGGYLLNPVITEKLVRDWYNFSKNGTSSDGLHQEYFEMLAGEANKYNVDEAVQAGYVMTKINYGQFLSLIVGVRYESEYDTYKAKYAPRLIGEFEYQTGIIFDTTAIYKKDFFLPNIHLKIKPLDWLDIKLAATKSISRPDFSMRLPTLSISTPDQQIISGNPYLNPAVAWNYDASMSLYSSQTGLFTVSGFRKNIDNIFYWLNDIKIMTPQQAQDLGLPVDKYGPFNQYSLNMPVNTNGTQVWGYELELQTHLSFLPGALQNIVVSANYSRVWSKTKYPRFQLVQSPGFPPKPPTPVFYDTEKSLSGQTDYTGNVALGYDYKGFSGRLSVYFQGPYLASISNLEYLDQYQKAFSRWDVALKQVVTENVSAFLNVLNFTNVIEGSYNTFRNLDNGGYLYGVTAELGLQLSL